MKRVVCLLFVLVFVVSFSVLSVGAQVDEDRLYMDFRKYCTAEMYNGSSDGFLYDVHIEKYVESDGIVFIKGCARYPQAQMFFSVKVGDWYFYAPCISAPHGLDVYVQSDGVIYDIKTAYEQGIVTDLTPTLEFVNGTFYIYPHGDANGDCTVDVKDATAIQKMLCDIKTTLVNEDIRNDLSDMNKDGIVNVKDATAIQKHIAGLPY